MEMAARVANSIVKKNHSNGRTVGNRMGDGHAGTVVHISPKLALIDSEDEGNDAWCGQCNCWTSDTACHLNKIRDEVVPSVKIRGSKATSVRDDSGTSRPYSGGSESSRSGERAGEGSPRPLPTDEEFASSWGSGGRKHCHLRLDTEHYERQHGRVARNKLILACVLSFSFMIAEAVGGYFANSLAVMTDAAHMLVDFVAYLISLAAIYIGRQAPSKRLSYGYFRVEVLGALLSVLLIWVITGILLYYAVHRIMTRNFEVIEDNMLIVSSVAIVFNIILGIILHSSSHPHSYFQGLSLTPTASPLVSRRSLSPDDVEREGDAPRSPSPSNAPTPVPSAPIHHRNINVRAAFVHVLGDFCQSVGVLVAAIIIKIKPEWKLADPICTFLFSFLVMLTTASIIRDAFFILMEAVPKGLDSLAVESQLRAISGVRKIHGLHLWALTLDKNACAVHLAIDDPTEHDRVLRQAIDVLRRNHHIHFSTIQVETYCSEMENCGSCR